MNRFRSRFRLLWTALGRNRRPVPHLKCYRFHLIRLHCTALGRPSAPVPHLKGHRFHLIRLHWTALWRASAPVPHLKRHRFHLIRLHWTALGRSSSPVPHTNGVPGRYAEIAVGRNSERNISKNFWRTLHPGGVLPPTKERRATRQTRVLQRGNRIVFFCVFSHHRHGHPTLCAKSLFEKIYVSPVPCHMGQNVSRIGHPTLLWGRKHCVRLREHASACRNGRTRSDLLFQKRICPGLMGSLLPGLRVWVCHEPDVLFLDGTGVCAPPQTALASSPTTCLRTRLQDP
jgi:hypothetical protein